MSNPSTFQGFYNLPALAGASYTTESGYVIPAAGVYPGLPSPVQVAANWLVLPALAGDITTGGILDYGRPFRVRVSLAANIANSENVTLALYQVTAAKFAAGVTATTNGTKISTTGAIATGGAVKGQLYFDTILQWDSASKILNGYQLGWSSLSATQGGVVIPTGAAAPGTKLTGSPSSLAENDLNFFFTILLGTGTSDTVGPIDFTIDRF
jgi:hypothetical protein